jgi:hypothetical protein
MNLPSAPHASRASLNALVPQASRMIAHPVYRSEARNLRRGRSLDGLVAYSLRRVAVVCALAVIVWTLFVWDHYRGVHTGYYTYGWAARRASENIIVWLAFVSTVGMLLLDFVAIMAAVRSVNADRTTQRWDLVRLTPLGRRDIIIAKHTIAQMRCWWFATIVTGLRLAAALLLALQFGALAIGTPPRTALADWLDGLTIQPITQVTDLGLTLALLTFFLLDPLLRLRMFTALGLAVSARVRSESLAVLAGLASMALLWLMQIIGMALLWSLAMALLFADLPNAAILLLVIAIIGLTFGAYGLLRRSFLRRAARDAFRD